MIKSFFNNWLVNAMKKIFLIFSLLISGFVLTEERAFCDLIPFPENSLNTILETRKNPKAVEACLDCSGDSCSIKPAMSQSKVCKRIYCTPSKRSKADVFVDDSFNSGGLARDTNVSLVYSFSISKEGKMTDIEVLEMSENIKVIKSRVDSKDIFAKVIESISKRISYEPVIVNGKKVKITNLYNEYTYYSE